MGTYGKSVLKLAMPSALVFWIPRSAAVPRLLASFALPLIGDCTPLLEVLISIKSS